MNNAANQSSTQVEIARILAGSYSVEAKQKRLTRVLKELQEEQTEVSENAKQRYSPGERSRILADFSAWITEVEQALASLSRG
jgi:hypothetical protein